MFLLNFGTCLTDFRPDDGSSMYLRSFISSYVSTLRQNEEHRHNCDVINYSLSYDSGDSKLYDTSRPHSATNRLTARPFVTEEIPQHKITIPRHFGIKIL
jgi:hypothetical protein